MNLSFISLPAKHGVKRVFFVSSMSLCRHVTLWRWLMPVYTWRNISWSLYYVSFKNRRWSKAFTGSFFCLLCLLLLCGANITDTRRPNSRGGTLLPDGHFRYGASAGASGALELSRDLDNDGHQHRVKPPTHYYYTHLLTFLFGTLHFKSEL